ncbi:helix-turn-helix domain-containing protein [Mycolicibacterium sp. 050158]|jgi:AcrR family transcriptional regulator|uniref:TetR/AcrR family transcriptional regulator n=1 Tax=Mycolicibacterium sp. 050158 TaxID=3090602 RepID=UPI00299F2761|nr:helix-turn-helix domain-containing protein [Mycolicibacterium sp. 050158]MDX1891847.1 helix-turn-helix domain-containing protein [Mycolicibacterium sp. 050158]
MPTRTHSADPRAERVRTLLRDAAFALAHERPVDEITVGDLAARAGVSRQVFYRHYTDRDDAVATAFATAFAAAAADIDGDARSRIIALFAFAAEHHSMYRNVVPSAVTQRVVAAFRDQLRPACDEIAGHAMNVVGPIADIAPESVSRFLVGGFQEVLRSWMEDPDHSTDLRARVGAALDTVDALLGLRTNDIH